MKKIAISLSLVVSLYGNTFIDKDTGLMWQDNSQVKNNARQWEDAVAYCNSLTLEGYSEWRLPDMEELSSIVDYKRSSPAIKNGFRNIVDNGTYWSSSPDANDINSVWFVYFYDGGVGTDIKSNYNLVCCVRDSKETLKFDSFSSLQNALKSKYKGKELTQKALEIYYGRPNILELKYDLETSTFTAKAKFRDVLNKNLTLTVPPSEATEFFENFNNITPIGVFDVKGDVATLKTIRFEYNGKKYNSNFAESPMKSDVKK